MKLTKLSLVAALLIGSSAFAIENTKVTGDVNLFYGTMDNNNMDGAYSSTNIAAQPSNNDGGLFDKESSYGDASVNLGLTTDLSEGVSAGVKGTFITTLGLENNLVDNTWSNSHGVTANPNANFSGGYQLDDSFFIGEMWIAGTAFDTTAKVGRQALDTPLAFTETWGIDQNTFEAAVLINQSIPDTTIVATYVGKSNGSASDTASALEINDLSAGQAGITSQDGKFNTFGKDGVYVAGIINNSWKPLSAQAWYYDLQSLATAYWLQADLNIEGVLVGAQYTELEVSSTNVDNAAYALMLGYEAKDVATVKVAYSSVDDTVGALGAGNVATSTSQSKLYTEMWWTYGAVSAIGADSYSITAETTVGPEINLLAGYYYADVDPVGTADDVEVTEIALTASKSFGPLDTSLAVIIDEFDATDNTNDADVTHLQVYLTYNF